jgi:hypothetical protein
MAYENLELIVVFNGSKSQFKPADYPGKLVLVTGGYDNSSFTAKDPYLYAIDDAGNYRVFDVPSSWVSGIKALKNGSTTNETITLQGVAEFLGANGISVSIDNNTKKLTIDGLGLLGKSTDQTTANTIYGAKALANKVRNDLLGNTTDGAENETIRGTRKLVDTTKTILEGNSSTDTADSNTIAGAKKYADKVKEDLMGNANTDNSILGIREDLSQAVLGATVTITESNGNYVVKQGDETIGTITIPKDMVVESGTIVVGKWTNNTFTENASGTGKALKLTIKNQTTPIYINVADLVDVYTAKASATQVQIAISNTNEISATIVPKSIGATELKDATITNAKIANSTIEKAKLATTVQASLGRADSSIQSVESTSDYITVNTKAGGTVYQKDVVANTATMSDVSSDGTKKGLATAEDVYAFISACLSVKILS